MKNKNNKGIINKIKGLLAKADEQMDDEGQSAFMLAQRLMIKYRLDEAFDL